MVDSLSRRALRAAVVTAVALCGPMTGAAAAAPSITACQQAAGTTIQQNDRWRVFTTGRGAPADARSVTICGRSKSTRTRVWRMHPRPGHVSITATALVGDHLQLIQSDGRFSRGPLLVDLRRGRVSVFSDAAPRQLLPTGAVLERGIASTAEGDGGTTTLTAYGDLTLFGPTGPVVVARGATGPPAADGSGKGPSGVAIAPSTATQPQGLYFTTDAGEPKRIAAPGPPVGITWSERLRPYRGTLPRQARRGWTEQMQNQDGIARTRLRVHRSSLLPYSLRSMNDPDVVLAAIAPRSLPDYRLLDAADGIGNGTGAGPLLVQARFADSAVRVPEIRVVGPDAPSWEGTPPGPIYAPAWPRCRDSAPWRSPMATRSGAG